MVSQRMNLKLRQSESSGEPSSGVGGVLARGFSRSWFFVLTEADHILIFEKFDEIVCGGQVQSFSAAAPERKLNGHNRQVQQVSSLSAAPSRMLTLPWTHINSLTLHALLTALSPSLSRDKKRYVDGLHYCTKTSWFANHPDDFPAPFDKAYRFEMGVEAVGKFSPGAGESGGGENGGPSSSSVVRPKMLVDYVRIAQAR